MAMDFFIDIVGIREVWARERWRALPPPSGNSDSKQPSSKSAPSRCRCCQPLRRRLLVFALTVSATPSGASGRLRDPAAEARCPFTASFQLQKEFFTGQDTSCDGSEHSLINTGISLASSSTSTFTANRLLPVIASRRTRTMIMYTLNESG